MRMRHMLAAALMAAPALLSAQQRPAKPGQDVTFNVMKANVARITVADERERWRANVEAWEVVMALGAKAGRADLDKLSASIATMKQNVAKVTEPDEKGRWQANLALWQRFVASEASFTKTDLPKARATLEKMSANVSRVIEAGEKERWTANRGLWQGMIDKAAGKLVAGAGE